MKLSSRSLLDEAHLHELLMRCAGLNSEQLRGGIKLKLEMFRSLLHCAALHGFKDRAAVCRLVVALNAGFPWEGSTWAGGYCSHLWPAGTIDSLAPFLQSFMLHPVLQLLSVLDVLDAETVCMVLESGIQADRSNTLVKAVLEMPAAVQLSTDHILQLADACLLHRNGDALSLLLQNTAAPGPNDPKVQFCRSMLFLA
jgi:hypothetical protein